MNQAIYTSSYMRKIVECALVSAAERENTYKFFGTASSVLYDFDWVEWLRFVKGHATFFACIADSPKGYDFEDDNDEIRVWIDAQPAGEDDCGWHGAIHALYVKPLRDMLREFEGAQHALQNTCWLGAKAK